MKIDEETKEKGLTFLLIFISWHLEIVSAEKQTPAKDAISIGL